jgi:purine-nucleoside phosphorylase
VNHDQPLDTFDRAEEAAAFIRSRCPNRPAVGIILGSGLDAVVQRLDPFTAIPYAEIPHMPQTSVAGHSGMYYQGRLGGSAEVAVFRGRFHHYEGHDLAAATFPVRVLRQLDVPVVLLTAAVGGISDSLVPGDLVVISDHLNLIGANPLRGPNDERLGTRFPDMTGVYAPQLRRLAHRAASEIRMFVHEGVYAAMPGPSYETPAEVRMLARLGADVVGMSTVPEAIVARHAGMEILAIALVANAAAGIAPEPLSHEEVLNAGRQAGPRLASLIEHIVCHLGKKAATGQRS